MNIIVDNIDDLKIPVQAGDFIFIPLWSMQQSINESPEEPEEMVFLALADFGLKGKVLLEITSKLLD